MIHAQEGSSGGLLRLLKSLERADYFGAPPRLRIELPSMIDPPTQRYLSTLKWPPRSSDGSRQINQLTLQHRLRPHSTTNEEKSIQFLESFYPTDPLNSHVVVLSTQAELSPLFHHYLMYSLLEYRYSSYGTPETRDDLLGISLEIPSRYLNGSTPFALPTYEAKADSIEGQQTMCLWEAPNSNAALYFGDKWVEFHDFARRRLEAQQIQVPSFRPKLISKEFPYWLELLLEFVHLRGYYMFYPGRTSDTSLVTVHHEQHLSPEEKPQESGPDVAQRYHPAEYLTTDSKSELPLTIHKSLLSLLPAEGDLPELKKVLVLSYDGTVKFSKGGNADMLAAFKREVGRCPKTRSKERSSMSAADLFCLEDGAYDKERREYAESHQTN